MKEERIICGDCLEKMDNLIAEGIVVDAIITDPPYGTTACSWDSVIPFAPMWERLNRLIKPNGAIVLFGSEPFSSALRMSNIKNYKYDWVWDKVKPTGMLNASHQPLRVHENVIIFCKSKSVYNPQKILNPKGIEKRSLYKYQRKNEGGETVGDIKKGGVSTNYEPDKLLPVSIQKFSKENKSLHPTQKPVALLQYLLLTYTNEGELVLDFTAGSGTTGVACRNLGRNFILIEKEPAYIKIIKSRLSPTSKNY